MSEPQSVAVVEVSVVVRDPLGYEAVVKHLADGHGSTGEEAVANAVQP